MASNPASYIAHHLLDAAASMVDGVDVVHLAPGNTVAWDNDCGQLYVQMRRTDPTVGKTGPCGVASHRLRFVVGVLRCVHTSHDDGTPPSAAEMIADEDMILDDWYTLLHAIVDHPPEQTRVHLVSWEALGPAGGMAGGEWTVDYSVVHC